MLFLVFKHLPVILETVHFTHDNIHSRMPNIFGVNPKIRFRAF